MCPPSETKTNQKAKGRVFITHERCKGCGFCIQFCPKKVLAFSKDFNSKGYHPPVIVEPENCIGCNLCGLFCPDFAIYAVRTSPGQEKETLEDRETTEGREEE